MPGPDRSREANDRSKPPIIAHRQFCFVALLRYSRGPTAQSRPGSSKPPPRCLGCLNCKAAALWNPGGTLVEPCLRATPDHPTALAEPRGTSWQPAWNSCGTPVEPWWDPRGTLPQGRPGPPRSLSGLRPQSFQSFGKNPFPKTCQPLFGEGKFLEAPASSFFFPEAAALAFLLQLAGPSCKWVC